MGNHSNYKALVLAVFPALTVERCTETPELFVMLNQHNQIFDEKTTAYSASKSWELAYRLMQRGELNPNWKEEAEKSMKETHAKLEIAKQDPKWRFMSHEDVSRMVEEVLNEDEFK